MKRTIFLFMITTFSPSFLFAEYFPVEFLNLSKNLLIHRSYELYSGDKIPSNGLIILNDDSSILIDTAWNNRETEEIVNYMRSNIHKPITACIITHSHQDRAGGLVAIQRNNIPIYMTTETNIILENKYKYVELKNGKMFFGTTIIDMEYFGPAHSSDNIIIYLPQYDVLFGGCIIKSINSTTIGSTADSNIKNWPKVVAELIKDFPNTKIVIPGHGNVGGMELLRHTLNLLK